MAKKRVAKKVAARARKRGRSARKQVPRSRVSPPAYAAPPATGNLLTGAVSGDMTTGPVESAAVGPAESAAASKPDGLPDGTS